ncbi:MAG: restriction endonuclease [Anaerolineaceae bacterium]|nr:restriction endonuclease [Anaerolineaceae bacterium]
MYCPACPAESLEKKPDNTKVVDFSCAECGAEFQLKAKAGSLGKKQRDAAYQPMIDRIARNGSPHFAFLTYDRSAWTVRNLILVPGHFLTPAAIERCPPLSSSARRAGWVGCNILVSLIPDDGRIHAISAGRALSKDDVRRQWARFRWLAHQTPQSRGWAADVLRCVRTLGPSEFTIRQMYEFAEELSLLHPKNRNILAKIRQQLQVLRDRKVLRFLGRGRYVAT